MLTGMIAQLYPLIEVFSDIVDFRKSRGKRHPDVLRHGVRLRERQCHRRMGT